MNELIPPVSSSESAVIRSTAATRLVTFKPVGRPGSPLVGYVDVAVGGLTFHEIPLFRSVDGMLSVGVPSAPVLDADGRQRLHADGRKQWRPLLSFNTADARAKWPQAVLAALEAAGISL